MNAEPVRISIREWSLVTPESDDALKGRFLSSDAARKMATELSERQALTVSELRHGLSLRTTSYVGRLDLDDLRITINPKVSGLRLLNLLRYAYGLRDLYLFPAVDYAAEEGGFLDLLLSQLAGEVQTLLTEGLHRRYSSVKERLAAPRGRIDVHRLAVDGGVQHASLPCIHHLRQEDILLNQVLLAGLYLAVRLTADLRLKRWLMSLATAINEGVAAIPLDFDVLGRAERQLNRLTRDYEPSLALVRMLVASLGTGLAEGQPQVRLPGFLFDTNRFFEALISRFLHEHLINCVVHDQFRLRDMMRYVPGYNPRGRKAPLPRPDFVVTKSNSVVSILDAKYVDLWERDLSRDILYQLSIYAMSQKPGVRAVILYPSADGPRPEARIELREPVQGSGRAGVAARAVDLARLEQLVSQRQTATVQADASQLAYELVFGKT